MGIISRMAVRNLRKHWRQSFAAMLTITSGFLVLGLFEGYMSDLRAHFTEMYRQTNMLGDLLIERPGAAEAAIDDDVWGSVFEPADQKLIDELLADEPLVTARMRFLSVSGMIDSGKASAVFIGQAYDLAEGLAMRAPGWEWNVTAGKPLDQAGSRAVLLGSRLARIVGCDFADGPPAVDRTSHPVAQERPVTCARPRLQLTATTRSGQLNAVEPEVAGVTTSGLDELDQRFVYLPMELGQRLLDTKAVTRYTVRLADPSRAAEVAARMNRRAHDRGLAIDARPWRDHPVGDIYTSTMALLDMFRNLVLAVVLVITGMAVFNTMTRAVGERIREIGTLRSLGFRRRHVVALFTTESAFLSVTASSVGLALTIPAAWAITRAGLRYQAGILSTPVPLTIAWAPAAYLMAAVFLCVVAVGAAWIPARKGSRLRIPDALGHV